MFSAACLFMLLNMSLSGAATVDTVDTYSKVMHKKIKAVVVLPDAYAEGGSFPVVYLLHGYSGNYADWIKAVPSIQQLADQYRILLVCPDGNFSSWYLDSPVDPSFRYETYMVDELLPWIDKQYHTVKNRSGRGITGLSMGGHGAFYLAFKHPDLFGAAGSMSGGVDFRPFPKNWDLAKRLGDIREKPENWDRYTVTNMLDRVQDGALALIFDCGTEDFFFKVNDTLHQKMLERKIPHDFIARPGKHDWPYWTNAIQYQLLFMHRFFEGKHA